MENTTIKLLYGMMLIILTNIITPAGKYEKQIRFLCGMIFSVMVLCIVSDICNICADKIPVFLFPEVAGYEDSTGIYEDINGYILSDYVSEIERDMEKKIYDELNVKCGISVSVNTDTQSEDYAEITSVTISGITEEDFSDAKKIIKSFYDTEEAHIFIHRKEE